MILESLKGPVDFLLNVQETMEYLLQEESRLSGELRSAIQEARNLAGLYNIKLYAHKERELRRNLQPEQVQSKQIECKDVKTQDVQSRNKDIIRQKRRRLQDREHNTGIRIASSSIAHGSLDERDNEAKQRHSRLQLQDFRDIDLVATHHPESKPKPELKRGREAGPDPEHEPVPSCSKPNTGSTRHLVLRLTVSRLHARIQ